IVDVASATEIVDVAAIKSIEPNYEKTRGKVDAGNAEPDGADVGVGMRVRG
ncbi:hypothetical protein KI387_001762, partial [Taxus chinensis]